MHSSQDINALLNENELFTTLANNIQNLAWMANEDGWIFWYNKRWYEYTGTTPEEMEGWGWQKVHHPDHVERILEFSAIAWKSNEPFDLTFPLRRHDGEYRWFLTRVFPVTNPQGEIIRWVGTNTDITEQKEAEDHFRNLIETLPQLVWLTDANGKAEYSSNKWEKYTGLDPSLEGTWSKIVHPDDLDNINETWANSLAKGAIYKSEARLLSKTGDYRWFSVTGEPVCDSDNKIIKWIGAFTDINTDKEFRQELERSVANRTNELAIAVMKLEEAKIAVEKSNSDLQKMNNELESFAYISSHDLQAPLRKIKTYSDLILQTDNNLSEKSQDLFKKIQLGCERMSNLIESLLAYSKLNNTEHNFERTDLDDLMQTITNDFEEELNDKGGVINVGIMGEATVIPFQFSQLMQNLIGNAIKFSDKDRTIEINVSAEIGVGKQLSEDSLHPDKSYYHFRISDNGIGFDQEYSQKIFGVFQRLHGAEKFKGSGIGLSIVKKIVDNHNGVVSAKSELNKGATFDIYLPIDQSNNG